MSRLPNAPLVEVVFELNWDIITKSDLIDFQYLYGDLYAILKENYPIRESLTPPEIPYEALKNIPVFRFRKSDSSYPLIQIGPGVISINTLNNYYIWEDFREEIHQLINRLKEIYPKFNQINIRPALIYIDFIKLDIEKQTGYDFINENFNITVNSNILSEIETKIKDINVNANYEIDSDLLSINITEGKANDSIEGLVLQTKINGKQEIHNNESLKLWLENAHSLSSKTFKSLIREELYNTFK